MKLSQRQVRDSTKVLATVEVPVFESVEEACVLLGTRHVLDKINRQHRTDVNIFYRSAAYGCVEHLEEWEI